MHLALTEDYQPGDERGLEKYSDQSFGDRLKARERMPGDARLPADYRNVEYKAPEYYDYRDDYGQDKRYFSKTTRESEDDHTGLIEENDMMFMRYLLDLYKNLTGEKIDLYRFKSTLEALEALKKIGDQDFLRALLNPERHRNAKIPAHIPIPTASFQLRSSFYVTTNAIGNAAIAINPFWLTTGGNSTVFVNNNGGLTGMSSSNFFTATSAGQTLPNAIYNQYRLVCGSVICKYVGRLDIMQGIIGGAIAYDKGITPTAVGTVLPGLARWGDFNLARDAMFRQEHYALSGLRELYFPIDNSFEEFQSLNAGKDGFMFFIYIQNAPPSTASFKVDLFFNFECLPDVEFLNYIPTEASKVSPLVKDEAYKVVRERAVTKESENQNSTPGNKPSGIESVIKNIGPVLNNVKKWGNAILGGIKNVKDIYSALVN
jgi:hypothetical protein